MATFEVTIETITVHPHPNADRLELAQVGLYKIVVAKDQWKTGDKVLYIPEYAVLPETLIVELGLEGKLAGPNKDRVKPVRLRGELSQGLVAPLSLVPSNVLEERGEKADYADVLGVKKWQPTIPANMGGDVEGAYDLISWIDVENIKKFPDLFTEGEEVIVDEKIHGTATLLTFVNPLEETPTILVSSKGLGEKKLVLKEAEANLYWKVMKNYKLQAFAKTVAEALIRVGKADGINKVGIFGETFGKVQDLTYGFTGENYGFRLFDIFVDYTAGGATESRWLNPVEVQELAVEGGVLTVPRLYQGPFSIAKIEELANGQEQVSGKELHIREGVVVRPVDRGIGYDSGKERIGKFVSEAYLTRGGNATEYN